jgi:hypothetical protein
MPKRISYNAPPLLRFPTYRAEFSVQLYSGKENNNGARGAMKTLLRISADKYEMI